MMANNFEVRKRGITTGPTTGVIEEYLTITAARASRDAVSACIQRATIRRFCGPVYDRDYFEGNYYLFMVSPATQATGASEAVGSTAHSMANNLGIQWRTR